MLVMILPTTGWTCFDGQWYGINYQDGVNSLFIAGIALVLAAVVQILANRFVWYVPVLVAAVAFVLPIVELLRWGNGDCGVGFVARSQLSVVVTGAFLVYEAFRLHRYYRLRRARGAE